MHLPFCCLVSVLGLFPGLDQPETLVGKVVVATRAGVEIRSAGKEGGPGKVIGTVKTFFFQVEKADREQLQVRSRGLQGWINKADVIPMDRATDYFSKRLRQDPRDSYALALRGALRPPKESAKALADYNQSIRLDPKFAMVYHWRANLYYGQKEYDKALADCNQTIRLDPQYDWAYHLRGWCWFRKKEHAKALADFNKELRLNPADAVFYKDRGSLLLATGEPDKALADLQKAVRLQPKYANAWRYRGKALAAKKEYAKALADYDQAIRLDAKFAPAYSARAWLLATCPEAKYRDGRKAVESGRRACELAEEAEHCAALAAAYAETGDFGKAVEWQTKAIKLAPTNEKDDLQARLRLYRQKKPYRQE
jgi:tetratricopeptide (TPR) repeat protein